MNVLIRGAIGLAMLGALASGWWLGQTNNYLAADSQGAMPNRQNQTVDAGVPQFNQTTAIVQTAHSLPAQEGHDTPVKDRVRVYCNKVWRGQTEFSELCEREEEAAHFELVSLCGTDELMSMWQSCATTSPSFAIQRHCLKQRLNVFEKRHERMSSVGLKRVASAEMSEGDGMKLWLKDRAVSDAMSGSILAITAGPSVVYVGASAGSLTDTLTSWRVDINTGLSRRRALSQKFDLSEWLSYLLEHGVLEIYARNGTVIETEAGRFNAYRSEAHHLSEEWQTPELVLHY